MAILFDVKIQKQLFALSIYFIISSLTGLRVVHKLRLQDEVGRWFKNGHFCLCLYHRKCQRRGVVGAPRLLRPPRPGSCLNFGLELTLSQSGGHIMPTTVLWSLSGSNSPWRPWIGGEKEPKYCLRSL